MEVQEFVKRWQVSREELAFICDCSLTTVNHWFSEGIDKREPTEKHEKRLELANYFFTSFSSEPEYLQKMREIFNQNFKNENK